MTFVRTTAHQLSSHLSRGREYDIVLLPSSSRNYRMNVHSVNRRPMGRRSSLLWRADSPLKPHRHARVRETSREEHKTVVEERKTLISFLKPPRGFRLPFGGMYS